MRCTSIQHSTVQPILIMYSHIYQGRFWTQCLLSVRKKFVTVLSMIWDSNDILSLNCMEMVEDFFKMMAKIWPNGQYFQSLIDKIYGMYNWLKAIVSVEQICGSLIIHILYPLSVLPHDRWQFITQVNEFCGRSNLLVCIAQINTYRSGETQKITASTTNQVWNLSLFSTFYI